MHVAHIEPPPSFALALAFAFSGRLPAIAETIPWRTICLHSCLFAVEQAALCSSTDAAACLVLVDAWAAFQGSQGPQGSSRFSHLTKTYSLFTSQGPPVWHRPNSNYHIVHHACVNIFNCCNHCSILATIIQDRPCDVIARCHPLRDTIVSLGQEDQS